MASEAKSCLAEWFLNQPSDPGHLHVRHADRQALGQKEVLDGALDGASAPRPVAADAPVLARELLHFFRGREVVPSHDPAGLDEGPVSLVRTFIAMIIFLVKDYLTTL